MMKYFLRMFPSIILCLLLLKYSDAITSGDCSVGKQYYNGTSWQSNKVSDIQGTVCTDRASEADVGALKVRHV